MDFLEYPSVSAEVRGAMVGGNLKITDTEVVFKHGKSGKKDVVKGSDIELVNWQRLAGVWGVRVFTKDGELHRFAGFKEAERERLASHFKSNFKLDMLDRELAVKGWNWGVANFNGGVIHFEVGKNDAFEIPLSYVQHCQAQKNEVTLEFALNEEASVNLSELRFHIPSSEQQAGDDIDPAEAFKEQVVKKANIGTTSTGAPIAIFREITSLCPRGRYDIKMYPTFIHLHGKTFDYKIPASTVMRLFLLPHKDQRQMFFCVNLDPPIKQGQTRYHYLIFTFMQEDELELELPFSEEELKEKYDGELEKDMQGPTFQLLSKMMKVLVKRKITVPGSFLGHTTTPAVSCSYKAASGFIYPLERGLIFIYKPPIFVKYEDVQSINFARSGGTNRSFDIEVSTRGDTVYTFSSIEKEEYSRLYDFFKAKKIAVKSVGKMEPGKLDLSTNTIDHHAELVKANAASDESGGDSDKSMSSDDEDFNPDKLEAKDAKEEYDSDPSDTGSDSGGDGEGSAGGSGDEEKKKAKAEKKSKKAARKATSAPSKKRGGEGGRKKKKTKLPGQPKKPMSAYFLWLNSEGREKIKEENPGIIVTEVSKKAGELWAEIDKGTKERFEEKAKAAKEKYEKDYKQWFEDGGEEAIKGAKADEAEGKSPKKKDWKAVGKASRSPKKSNPSAGGSGKGFKSAEFIKDSGSESDEDKKSESEKEAEEEEDNDGVGGKGKEKDASGSGSDEKSD